MLKSAIFANWDKFLSLSQAFSLRKATPFPCETRYFLLILPKCKMVHYMKLTNICLTLLVNSFFSLCILPNSSEYALWCILAKLLTFCITIHYGAFSLTIFLHNCPHKSQVVAAGFPLLLFCTPPPVSGFCATSA